MTSKENALLIKLMFRKINRRGLKEKRPVTNMYSVMVIPEEEAEQIMILNQPTQRTNE